MSNAPQVKGKPVIPNRGPQDAADFKAYSSAKPLNHDSFKSRDARVVAFQMIKDIEQACKLLQLQMDDPKERVKFCERVQACVSEVKKTC